MRKTRASAPGEIRIEAFGLRILVRVEPRSFVSRVRPRLPSGSRRSASRHPDATYGVRLRPGPAEAPVGELSRGGRILLAGADPEALLDALESDLERLVAERARRVVFVHAGVVGWRNRAILLPGRSGSGKTTLVAALVKAGCTYLSDEFAVLDADGRVHPFPRRPGIRDDTGVSGRVPAETLGGRIGRRPLRPGMMLALTYSSGSGVLLRSLSPGQAAMALLENTVAARSRPRAALAVLARAVGGLPAWSGDRGEADDFAEALLAGRLPV